MDEARQVREFWFGTLPLSADALAERSKLWFGEPGISAEKQKERDDSISARFGSLIEQAGRGELAAWADSPRRRLNSTI